MKKILLIISLIANITAFAQLPYNETFGVGTSAPSGWTLNSGWAIDNLTYFPVCDAAGTTGGSYLWGDNSVNGLASLTFTFSSLGNTAVTINFNEIRQTGSTQVLTVITSTNNFATSTTFTVTGEPLGDDVTWQAVTPINLPANFDNQSAIQVKFEYTGDNTGVSIGIDDLMITGITAPIFYWKGSGSLDVLSNWTTSPNGIGGTAPSNFTDNGQEFNIVNGASATISSGWTVSGTSTVIKVGDGVTGVNFTIPSTNSLTLSSASLTVLNGSTLTLQNTTNFLSATSVSLATNSTVDFAQSSSVSIWNTGVFENLTISGASKDFNSNITINGIFNLNAANANMAANRTITMNGTITGSGNIDAASGGIFIGGTGAFGTLNFSTTNPTIRNLSINRAGSGTVILGSNLSISNTIGTTFNLTNGILDLNSRHLNIGARTCSFGGGFLKGSSTSSLTVSASTSLSGSLLMDQTSSSTRSLADLTLNSTGRTLTIGNALNIINSITPTLGTIALGSGNVTLKSTSAKKARVGVVGGAFSGTLNVETFIPGGSAGWNTIGPAGISGLTVSNWDGGSGSATGFAMTCSGCINNGTSAGGAFVSIVSDPAGNGVYTDLISSSSLTPGTGYWAYIGSDLVSAIDITQTTTGPVVTGDVTNSTGFMSNPYASPISLASLQASNPGLTSLDVYNPNSATYVSYNGGIPSDIIPMGQGFYTNGVTSVTFRESNKTSGNNSMLKTATSIGNVFQLKIDGWYGDYDNAYVRFHNDATPAFDDLLDAYKRYATPGYAGIPGVYTQYTTISTMNANQDYAINSLPYNLTTDAVIPVLAKASATGQYTISPIDIHNLPANSCVILKDKLLDINHDLRTGSYVFNMADTTSAPRFELTICAGQYATGVKQNASINNNVLIGQDGAAGVFVKTTFDKNTKSVISAYNVMGQKIIADKEVEGTENLVYLDFKDMHNQIVIIKVANEKGQTTKKVFLN
jgi:hypothetical protein